MVHINIEIKARCTQTERVRNYLLGQQAMSKGTDYQRDTYFQVNNGRLKLREGNIENNLIYYKRPDQAGPKASEFTLLKTGEPATLKNMLKEALGIKAVVSKRREIYFLGNVKFHIDEVESLGAFVEIEASNLNDPSLSREQLLAQCNFYLEAFAIKSKDLLTHSYSDMIIDRK